jgi:hypothetical protein
MKTPKIINIVGVGGSRGGHINIWYVTITTHMFLKLPEWVQAHIRCHHPELNTKHISISIEAVDELQALVRFQQLWDCLPKEDK